VSHTVSEPPGFGRSRIVAARLKGKVAEHTGIQVRMRSPFERALFVGDIEAVAGGTQVGAGAAAYALVCYLLPELIGFEEFSAKPFLWRPRGMGFSPSRELRLLFSRRHLYMKRRLQSRIQRALPRPSPSGPQIIALIDFRHEHVGACRVGRATANGNAEASREGRFTAL